MSNKVLCNTRIAAALVAGLVLTAACGTDSASSAATDLSDSTPTTSEAVASTTDPSEAPAVTNEPDTTSSSTTTSTTTTSDAPAVTIPESSCQRIADFDSDGGSSDSGSGWFVVNDGVMGGGSNGVVDIGDSVMRFSGTVVTNGGGFTSVRYRLDGEETAGTTRLSLRVRADDRVYGVTLEDEAAVGRRSVSHRADLDTTGATDDDGWTVATVDYAELRPSIFGQQVDAAPFNPDAAREIGIIIADGRDGEFSLDVDWIDVCD